MLKVLNKPYPLNKELKDNLIITFIISVFLFFFLLLFEPFNTLITYSISTVIVYTAITFVVSLGIATLFPIFLPSYFNETKWTVGKEILHMSFIVFAIGVLNFLYAVNSFSPKGQAPLFSLYNFSLTISITFIIGIMPIIIVVLYNQTRLLKKYKLESELINQKKHTREVPTDEIIFIGEGKNEQLKLQYDAILFIKSENNYCEIYVQEAGLTKKKLLRVTLTSIENTLKSFDAFIRVHRSYIVNSNNIEQVSGSAQGYRLHFKGIGTTVPVSRNKSSQFKSFITN